MGLKNSIEADSFFGFGCLSHIRRSSVAGTVCKADKAFGGAWENVGVSPVSLDGSAIGPILREIAMYHRMTLCQRYYDL